MDRRQGKTREAIFNAFIKLLSSKNYNHITVGEIIDEANIGRATFYSHFETKDFLLKELCADLFEHIFNSYKGIKDNTKSLFDCKAPNSVFLHLFDHLKKNDNNILDLFASPNNDLFLMYFKDNLKKLIVSQKCYLENSKFNTLPNDYLINHIASTFVETVRWWANTKFIDNSETINQYFLEAIK